MSSPGATLLLSDLHLAPDTPAVTDRFLTFLSGTARHANHLIILGDLFDAWAGDDDLSDPFNVCITTALQGLAKTGVRIELMCGNRDFLLGDAFAEAAGLTLITDPCVRNIGGIRTLLLHGDTLCTDDRDYQHFRTQVRSAEWRSAFLALPMAERKQQIATLRRRSENEKRIKSMAIMDVNEAAVMSAFATHQVHVIIHGHTHRQQQHHYTLAGQACTRWVLGDWTPAIGPALRCESNDWYFTH